MSELAEGSIYGVPDVVQRLVDGASSTGLRTWLAQKQTSVRAATIRGLKRAKRMGAPPIQPVPAPRGFRWTQRIGDHDIGEARLMKTAARRGAYAVHKEADHFVIDHVPTGLRIVDEKKLAQARAVIDALHEKHPTFGASTPFGAFPSTEEIAATMPTIAEMKRLHGARL